MLTKTSIAIVDDHFLFRQGMKSLLEEIKDFEIPLQASNGRELLDQLKALNTDHKKLPDIILLDIQMPVMDGIDTTVKLKKRYPELKVIILTMHDDEEMIVHLIEKGANGFLPKNEDFEHVVDAIRSVMDVGYYFNDRISKAMVKGLVNSEKIKPKFYSAEFNVAELEVMKLICKEHTNKEIADRMGLSIRTIEGHRFNILKKTGARNTAGIVMYAVKNNLVL